MEETEGSSSTNNNQETKSGGAKAKVPKPPKKNVEKKEKKATASTRKSAKPMYNVSAFTSAGSVTPLVDPKKEPEEAIVMKLSVFQNAAPDFTSDLFAFNDFGHSGAEWSPFESVSRQDPVPEVVETAPKSAIGKIDDFWFRMTFPTYN